MEDSPGETMPISGNAAECPLCQLPV